MPAVERSAVREGWSCSATSEAGIDTAPTAIIAGASSVRCFEAESPVISMLRASSLWPHASGTGDTAGPDGALSWQAWVETVDEGAAFPAHAVRQRSSASG